MAVAWAGERVGAASRPMVVRDAVLAEALLPRFLAPGDRMRIEIGGIGVLENRIAG